MARKRVQPLDQVGRWSWEESEREKEKRGQVSKKGGRIEERKRKKV